ncbi:MAG: hypothetical protein PUC65_12770 [Clostridiales bacterium]|nr:hypothetical protein [Clostridiales bacterium]
MVHKRKVWMMWIVLVMVSMALACCKHKTKQVDEKVVTPTVLAMPTITEAPSTTPTFAPTTTPVPTPTEAAPWLGSQIDSIIQLHPIYSKYRVDQFEFGDMFVLIFQPPESKREFCEFYCDIWVVGEHFQSQIVTNSYVDYGMLKTGEIEGKTYFRYDLSYPSESLSYLLMMDENQQLHQIGLGGELISINGNNLTVTHSTYDMCYMKADGYACGHTWKPYYYYLDGYELKEYSSHEIREQNFKIYTGSLDVIQHIVDDYSEDNAKLILKYMGWENKLVTVSIGVETLNDISYYYETYQINDDQTLTKFDSGYGTYVGLMLNENPYVRILNYSKEDNTIEVQIVEGLYPWEDRDKRRLQEMIEEGLIVGSSELWTSKFYLYEEPENVLTYQLSEEVSIVLRDEDTFQKEVGKEVLEEDLTQHIMMLTLVDNAVTMINEPYLP